MSERLRESVADDHPFKRLRHGVPDRLSSMSDEILLRTLSYLPISSLALCQRLSHRLNALAGDQQLWKSAFYNRFVRPRASRIPGIRRCNKSTNSLYYSSRISKWLEDDHLVKKGKATNWMRQYKLRHKWSRGSCDISEIKISEHPSIPPLLVRLHEDIVVTVDSTNGLRAWTIQQEQRLIATMALYVDETDSRRPGPPTSLVLDTLNSDGDILSMSVGFADGRFSIYSLQKILRTFTHRYTHPPSINGMISAIAYASPYILTMTEARLLSLYTFGTKIMKIDCALSSPRLLSSLKSHTAWPPLSLSIRVSSASIVASIAYAIPTYLSGWSVGLQELRLGPEGDILESRLATALNQGFTPLHSPSSGMSSPNLGGGSSPIKGMYSNMISHSTRPTSLSYTHPYLLASHPDNTLTLYMVTSTAENLFVGAGNRLWGHTSSVSGAHVGDRGKAVSISTHGNEIRIWELEGGTASSLSSRRQAPAKVSVQIRPERNSSVNRGLQETTEQRGTCLELSPEHVADELEIARGWVAFDEEKVIVLREKDQGAQALFVYDFS